LEQVEKINIQIQLSSKQLAFINALEDKSPELAKMYLGSLYVMNQNENPDRYAQAAHSIREFINAIPKIVQVPIEALNEDMGSKVNDLQNEWNKTCQNSDCYKNNEWEGKIDSHLRKLLKNIFDFFDWKNKHRPKRKKEIISTFRELDGSNRQLPEKLEEINVNKWMMIRDYFIGIAHHKTIDPSYILEFNNWLAELENFLLDILIPRTFNDFEIIDKIIEEGDKSA